MVSRLGWLTVWCVLSAAVVFGQAGSPLPSPTTTPGIAGVVARGTEVRLIKDGFNGAEGPIPTPDGGFLFGEYEADRIIKIDKDGKVSTYLENANRTAGLAYDAKGRLIATQSRQPKVVVLAPTPSVLADTYAGQPLVRPNDLVVDKRGGIYFTDPLPNPGAAFRPPPADRKPALFYIRPSGELVKISEEIERPNGIQLSPDEKTLYATNGPVIVAFDVQSDGTVRRPRDFVNLGAHAADGLAVDAAGRLYAGTGAGVQVLSPDGKHLGTIPIPHAPQNMAFGGPDKKTLLVVGRGAAYQIRMLAQGVMGRAK